MANIKWGEKKIIGHTKNRKANRREVRAIEKKTRQKAKRALRKESW
jgi:hypothetical protein